MSAFLDAVTGRTANAYRWDNDFLAKIASAFTETRHGRKTRVEWHDTRRWWGETQNDGTFFVLRLSYWQPLAEVKNTFFHECAHLTLHPPPVRTEPGMDLQDVAQGRRLAPGNQWLAEMETFLKKREQEADDWTQIEIAKFPTFWRLMTYSIASPLRPHWRQAKRSGVTRKRSDPPQKGQGP